MKPGSRPPDFDAVDLTGAPRRLHEFRRRGHVLVFWKPEAPASERATWTARRVAESQRWTWLQLEGLVPAQPLNDAEPGLYLISRWGQVVAAYPPGDWDMDRIERDLLTFEAQDCCDLSQAP
ncbi:MAG TPA: hypothetical protein VE981_17660 [Planctomycetota bacterium]|nr:hypothetical protein [Planctomycetota bacterium]